MRASGLIVAFVTAVLSPSASAANDTLIVVDDNGDPVAGATVQWGNGVAWLCDTTKAPIAAYTRLDSRTSDAAGRVSVVPGSAIGLVARAVTSDGRAGFGVIDASRALVVHRVATIEIAPSCGGACSALELFGTITTNRAVCRIVVDDQHRVLANVVPGELELHLRAAASTANERALTIRTPLSRDWVLTPALPRVAGTLALAGTLTAAGKPPTGPSYRSSASLQCGPELTRTTTIDSDSGRFVFDHLPARPCVLHVSMIANGRQLERDVRVEPGQPVSVDLDSLAAP